MAEQSITGFLNPVLNIPLQEQFESFSFLMPTEGKFNIRPLSFNAPQEGEAAGPIQKRFDKMLLSEIGKMGRRDLNLLALQVFNAKGRGEFTGLKAIKKFSTEKLKNILWKNIILTTSEGGS